MLFRSMTVHINSWSKIWSWSEHLKKNLKHQYFLHFETHGHCPKQLSTWAVQYPSDVYAKNLKH